MLDVDRAGARRPLCDAEEYVVDGASDVHLVVKEGATVSSAGQREELPAVSAPFTFGDRGRFKHVVLPAGSKLARSHDPRYDYGTPYLIRNGSVSAQVTLKATRAIARPDMDGALKEGAPDETSAGPEGVGYALADFIDWQVACFQEMHDLSFAESHLDSDVEGRLTRRGWSVCRAAWLGDANDRDQARMALIVKLARTKALQRTLEKLCRAPRRILERYRGKEHLGRIQQLDAACLRWYSRQPGNTPAEKAGSSQKLLSVKRRETFDTLENRVLKWVLLEMERLCGRYLRQNRRYRGSQRCKDVKRLHRELRGYLLSEPICHVPHRLVSPLVPNYPLQQNPDYKQVWSTYKRLVANRRELEDSWRWHRLIWKEACSQLLGGALTHQGLDLGLKLLWPSATCYFRHEGQYGLRIEGPSTPGPFQAGQLQLDLINPREGAPPKGLCDWLGHVGGDMAILSRDASGAVKRGCVVWFVSDWTEEHAFSLALTHCAVALRRQSEKKHYETDSDWPLDGLLLMNAPAGADVDRGVVLDERGTHYRDGRVVAMQIPTDLHAKNASGTPGDLAASKSTATDDFMAGIHLAVEALLHV
jgi:hypothetical protein